eukprot:TRINITY_DN15634_c0_g1_i2.p1 TRINITY_DN15634_c0_g1~~TRINITY_DN15634_c0_g1_i2.p1  ORF type:complete len:180 (-),score=53.48 TRINITY_DN15634_c0_g1_i2:213-752(-)
MPPMPDNFNVPPVPRKLDPREEEESSKGLLEKYKRRCEQSEALVLGYEEKLKQANRKISELKEKEKRETEEMENALKLITKKLVEMQVRAEKAEAENIRLSCLLQNKQGGGGGNHTDCTHDWQMMSEKTSFALNSMNRIATQSEQSLKGLIEASKEFHLLMEMLHSMDKISTARDIDRG